MPNFATPFIIKKCDRKLNEEELIRAVRFSIADEFEAIQVYEQLEEATDNAHAKAVLKHVIEEEKVHVGEFMELLKTITPDEFKSYKEGQDEAKETMK